MKFSKALFTFTCALALLSACGGRKDNTDNTATFRVERVTLDKTVWDAGNPSEARNFSFKACLTDAVSFKAIENARFKVSDGENQILALTDNIGCMLWNERHPMLSIDRPRMVQFRRVFIGQDAFKGEVSVEMAMNPWGGSENFFDLHVDNSFEQEKMTLPRIETSVKFNFRADLRVGFNTPFAQNTDGEEVNLEDGRYDIQLPKITLHYSGLDKSLNEVDSLLSLKTAQKYEMRLEPEVIRRDLQDMPSSMDLTTGDLNVQIFLVTDNMKIEDIKANNIVAHFSGDVKIGENGIAARDIVLKLEDLSAVLSRTRMYVILRPLGQLTTYLRPGVFTGHVGPTRVAESSFSLIPVQDRTSVLRVMRASMEALQAPQNALQLFTQEPGAVKDTTIALTDLGQPWSKERREEVRNHYCELFYDNKLIVELPGEGLFWTSKWMGALDACRTHSDRFVKVTKGEFVEEIEDSEFVPGTTMLDEISISRSIDFVQSYTDSVGGSSKFSAGVSVGLDLGAQLGIGGKSDTSIDDRGSGSVSESDSQSGKGPKITGVDDKSGKGGTKKGPVSLSAGLNAGIKAGWGGEIYQMSRLEKTKGEKVVASFSSDKVLNVAAETYQIKAKTRTCLFVIAPEAKNPQVLYQCDESVNPARSFYETYYSVRQKLDNSIFTDDEDSNSADIRTLIRGPRNYELFKNAMTQGNSVLHFAEWIPTVDWSAPLLPAAKINQDYMGMVSEPLQ